MCLRPPGSRASALALALCGLALILPGCAPAADMTHVAPPTARVENRLTADTLGRGQFVGHMRGVSIDSAGSGFAQYWIPDRLLGVRYWHVVALRITPATQVFLTNVGWASVRDMPKTAEDGTVLPEEFSMERRERLAVSTESTTNGLGVQGMWLADLTEEPDASTPPAGIRSTSEGRVEFREQSSLSAVPVPRRSSLCPIESAGFPFGT